MIQRSTKRLCPRALILDDELATTRAGDSPYLSYLRALSSWDRRFPGFGHDTHGVEVRNDQYFVQCLEKEASDGH